MEKKCVVLLSDGLDSRLAVKIMQEQGFEIYGVHFKLPFSKNVSNDVEEFAKDENVKLKIFDCTKESLLKEYFEVIKTAKHGTGAGVNPCVDCHAFIFRKAKEFADEKKIDLIVTGEVLGERPMSQMRKSMQQVLEESELNNRLLRPLSAKLLPETEAEKQGLVDREKLYAIQGRKREKQMQLADEFDINYPTPGGGCFLCEKDYIKRFRFFFKRGLKQEEIQLINIGRHFVINGSWVVLSRDEKEGILIEAMKIGKIIVPDYSAPSAIILDKTSLEIEETIHQIIKAYSKKGSLEERDKFKEMQL